MKTRCNNFLTFPRFISGPSSSRISCIASLSSLSSLTKRNEENYNVGQIVVQVGIPWEQQAQVGCNILDPFPNFCPWEEFHIFKVSCEFFDLFKEETIVDLPLTRIPSLEVDVGTISCLFKTGPYYLSYCNFDSIVGFNDLKLLFWAWKELFLFWGY